LKDVSFAYGSRLDESDDDTPVLHDISLHVASGQHVALVGPSGSGKTTIARLVARLTDPTIGRVQIGGVTLTEVANDELRRRLIVVPQEPFLFANTIEYNLQFANPAASAQIMVDSFKELGLSDWLQSLPLGLQTQVGQRGSSLSAGERQLVALVRASIVKPDVLVLDEATSSVDSLTEVRISHALERLAVGRTTISIAHRLSTASRADRVIMLEHGRIVEDGSHFALISAGGKYASLYETWINSTSGASND
jgi:putative ABC transport system ATP-binding protein